MLGTKCASIPSIAVWFQWYHKHHMFHPLWLSTIKMYCQPCYIESKNQVNRINQFIIHHRWMSTSFFIVHSITFFSEMSNAFSHHWIAHRSFHISSPRKKMKCYSPLQIFMKLFFIYWYDQDIKLYQIFLTLVKYFLRFGRSKFR